MSCRETSVELDKLSSSADYQITVITIAVYSNLRSGAALQLTAPGLVSCHFVTCLYLIITSAEEGGYVFTRSVCLFVCLFVCLSVRRITYKVVNGF